MGKVLLLILVGLVAYFLWKGLSRNARSQSQPPPGTDAERMVDCRQCGVHLPISEAVESGGDFFCSDEHRRMFSR